MLENLGELKVNVSTRTRWPGDPAVLNELNALVWRSYGVHSLMAANKISSVQAVGPILIGLTTNTLMKAVVAFKSGGIH